LHILYTGCPKKGNFGVLSVFSSFLTEKIFIKITLLGFSIRGMRARKSFTINFWNESIAMNLENVFLTLTQGRDVCIEAKIS
jgi:hypothetical protein